MRLIWIATYAQARVIINCNRPLPACQMHGAHRHQQTDPVRPRAFS
jgi:hypothetical protein